MSSDLNKSRTISCDGKRSVSGAHRLVPRTGSALDWRALLQSCERDRVLLSCEIHDGIVQHLTGTQMRLGTLLADKESMGDLARREVETSLKLIEKSIEEARHLVRGLRPPLVNGTGLVAALKCLVAELPSDGPTVEFEANVHADRFSAVMENCVYRMVQEALNNAIRHSRSDRVAVCLTQVDDTIQLQICDWGIGFDVARVAANRYGLEGIRQRARLLGGWTKIESDPGKGTRIFVELPLAHEFGEEAPCKEIGVSNE